MLTFSIPAAALRTLHARKNSDITYYHLLPLNNYQHAKFARKKVLTTLQYMDPVLIESHTGMKVLTHEEFEKLSTDLEETRKKIREMNSQVQQKYSEVLKATMDIQNMKQEIEELKKLIDGN